MKPRRFYATQFGSVWSLSPEGFRQYLEDGAKGQRDLDKHGQKIALRANDRSESLGPAALKGKPLIRPLDQKPEWFVRALEAFDKGEPLRLLIEGPNQKPEWFVRALEAFDKGDYEEFIFGDFTYRADPHG